MTPEELRQVRLPKWPQMLTGGDDVTVEQAKEIVRRTDYFMCSPPCFLYREDGREADFILKLNMPYLERNESWTCVFDEKLAKWHNAMGTLPLNYTHNDWIMCAYIFGPHGWCSPEGKIGFIDNIGKWPSVHEVEEDWLNIAKTFPFLNLTAVLANQECCEDEEEGEEEKKFVVGFHVHDGNVELFDPDKEPDRIRKPSYDISRDEAAMFKVLNSVEHPICGVPVDWIDDWSKLTD